MSIICVTIRNIILHNQCHIIIADCHKISSQKSTLTKNFFIALFLYFSSSKSSKYKVSCFPGPVEDAVMLMDQITKRHRGFGFVTFQAEETVELVCELHYHTINNKKVEVKKAQPKECVMSANTAALLGKRLVMMPSTTTNTQTALVNIPTLLQPALHQQPMVSLSQIGMYNNSHNIHQQA